MNKRQREKRHKKQLLYIKTKDTCACGKDIFKINYNIHCCVDHTTIFCIECGVEYNCQWVNHRRLKILY